MQILAIVLYSKSGKRRLIRLEPGKVNIITGRSRTGKSALINIVDYCLGSGTCKVARGPIRNTVAWYGLLLQLPNSQLFIARQNPVSPAKSTNIAYFVEAGLVEVPVNQPIQNTTIDDLITTLGAKLGISPNLHIPPEGQTRQPLSANFRHAVFYSFQAQNEISNPKILFHRQDESAITQTIKDSLPYFLGVVREDALALQQELRRSQRAFLLLRRELGEMQDIRGNGISRAFRLLEEARQLGLIPENFNASLELDPIVEVLEKVLDWTPEQVQYSGSDQLPRLIEERRELQLVRQRTQERFEAVQANAQELEGYTSAADEHVLRLEAIGLYEDHEHNSVTCPICQQPMDQPTLTLSAIASQLQELKVDLADIDRGRPQLRKLLEDLERARDDLDVQIKAKYEEIQILYEQRSSLAQLRDADIARGRVVGRVSLWLESVNREDELAALQARTNAAEYQVLELENKASEANRRDRLDAVLISLGVQMTGWANQLNVEHSGAGTLIQIDWSKASLSVSTLAEEIPLAEMGSGENHLAYHLIAHFALHSYFVKHKRPTPKFLFLDQPTQVYFPEDSERVRAIKESGSIEEGDRTSVNEIFDFIFELTEALAPHFQVVISDHANLINNERFQSSVREVWRDGNALIPQEWIDELQADLDMESFEQESDTRGVAE
jgi:hypothetical protein